MLVIHACWESGTLKLWGESLNRFAVLPPRGELGVPAAAANGVAVSTPPRRDHPFAADGDGLAAVLKVAGCRESAERASVVLHLPGDLLGPWPSDRLSSLVGVFDHASDPMLGAFEADALSIAPLPAMRILRALCDQEANEVFEVDQSVRFWATAARFARGLLGDQRYVPTLQQVDRSHLAARWTPWLHDEEVRNRFQRITEAMPPAARATGGDAYLLLERSLEDMTDACIRNVLVADDFLDAIDGRDPAADAHVSWLSGLLGADAVVPGDPDRLLSIFTDARRWLGRLCDTGEDLAWRLLLELREPEDHEDKWYLRLALQSAADPSREVSADEVWAESGSERGGDDRLPEVLLAELDRAAALYPRLEDALGESAPCGLILSTTEAHRLLIEYMPLLEESGFRVLAPSWWAAEEGRLTAHLHIDAPPLSSLLSDSAEGGGEASMLGLAALVDCSWQLAIGDHILTPQEFESLRKSDDPLIRVGGRWVHLEPSVLAEAQRLIAEGESKLPLSDALRLAHGDGYSGHGLTIGGLTADGWVGDLLDGSSEDDLLPDMEQPEAFEGQLRPYQLTGLRWLAFLSRFGIGSCLADDMGLGKTIQLIALLLQERQQRGGSSPGPTLLVVPTSVVTNWSREIDKFAPTLRFHVQHGTTRPLGAEFVSKAMESDVIITTYGLVHRDLETLNKLSWYRIALDEAQYIKNPPTKQAKAIRSLHGWHRAALTGTPVENRLAELWSIMDFLNPGYLGSSASFRRHFSRPIEQRRDPRTVERLRRFVQPFILRRVKTDATVIDDLPECVQTREYANLTGDQAKLYGQVVSSMLREVDRSEGMQRRGLVLATLVKLKQICNHPMQYLNAGHGDDIDAPKQAAVGVQASRSGKARRLMTLLEEIVASGERAIVFTQYREMGRLLTAMIQHDLNCETLFLHGGTPVRARQQMIDRFQDPRSTAAVFVLSLKAGGIGVNLTAANHVFHFDRWWNPAVENQATDRAYRIGQTRTVHVHKFVCIGTLEERIDQMIEQKTELAEHIIGSGEQGLSELSTGQLREILSLRESAVEMDA